ncbi:MAG: hypothetical protein O7F73_03390 [Gammaproteobacteria bacterium]|nr:hypothetical protein [Gammaproteobacteria bacterium]
MKRAYSSKVPGSVPSGGTPSGLSLPALALFSTLLLFFSVTPGQAQGARPQRAIEALEGCSAEERKQGCITILTRRPAGENKQAIKAQVRGGRIIWYEYNSKTGQIRRTN